MAGLDFQIDWLNGDGIKGPELSATQASLRILIDDAVITRVLDTRARTTRDDVYVSVYPLAEWLATHWWFLTYEVENPAKADDPGFLRRHTVRTNLDGYPFPKLKIVPSGARVHIVWTRSPSQWARVDFLHEDQAWMDRNEFSEVCANFIDRVILRLEALDISGTFLQEEWAAIRRADDDESEFCRAAAALGWDPYALDDSQRDLMLEMADQSTGAVLEEAMAALDPQNLRQGWSSIVNVIAKAKCNSLDIDIESLRHRINQHEYPPDTQPWRLGYGLARRVRRALDLNGEPLPTTADLANAFDTSSESFGKVMEPVNFGVARLVEGAITQDGEGKPAFALRQSYDAGKRFGFCRALAETLEFPESDTLLTKARSERQQRNRAFAAEFLAPSSGLRDRISGSVVDDEYINELAVEFGVSPRVIEHQVKNHEIAKIWPEREG